MAKKKLTLATVKKAIGVGELVKKIIKFTDANGGEFEGEIFIKRLSHDDRVTAIDEWNLEDRKKATFDQLTKAILFRSVFVAKDHRFFPNIEDTGTIPTEIIEALNGVVDEVNDLSGKKSMLKQKNSGVNSSSTESVEEPLNKPSEK